MPRYDDPIWVIVALGIFILAGVVDYIRGNQQSRARNTPNAAEPEKEERSPRLSRAFLIKKIPAIIPMTATNMIVSSGGGRHCLAPLPP